MAKFVNILFANTKTKNFFIKDLNILEALLLETKDQEEMVVVGQLYDELLDSMMCRGRNCGQCDGVRCEEAVLYRLEPSSKMSRAFRAWLTKRGSNEPFVAI